MGGNPTRGEVTSLLMAGNPKAAKFLPIRALRATSSRTTRNQRADDPGSGRLWAEGRGEPGAGDRDDRGRAAARSRAVGDGVLGRVRRGELSGLRWDEVD